MATIPGLDADVFFGTPETPLPDWRELGPDDGDDDPVADRESVSGLLGFDLDEAYPDEDDDDFEDDEDFEELKLPTVKPSPFKSKSLPTTRNLAARYDKSGQLVPADTDEGEHVKGWIENGVPSVKGVEIDGVITEKPTIVQPDSPVFGLALLEAIERHGWKVE